MQGGVFKKGERHICRFQSDGRETTTVKHQCGIRGLQMFFKYPLLYDRVANVFSPLYEVRDQRSRCTMNIGWQIPGAYMVFYGVPGCSDICCM